MYFRFFSGKCFALPKHLLYQTKLTQITGTLRNHLRPKQFLMAEWFLWTNDLWSNMYVFQHFFLTHWIFPMHHKLSFSSVKWSRNRIQANGRLHALCVGVQPARGHLEALLLVLARPPWFKKDLFLVFFSQIPYEGVTGLGSRSGILLPVTAECREDQSGFWKQECSFLTLCNIE